MGEKFLIQKYRHLKSDRSVMLQNIYLNQNEIVL